MERLEELGAMPLPPYRQTGRTRIKTDIRLFTDPEACGRTDSGTHFTKELLAGGRDGRKTCYVTLHVGIGTFRPLR